MLKKIAIIENQIDQECAKCHKKVSVLVKAKSDETLICLECKNEEDKNE